MKEEKHDTREIKVRKEKGRKESNRRKEEARRKEKYLTGNTKTKNKGQETGTGRQDRQTEGQIDRASGPLP